jgi:hypothetical protein
MELKLTADYPINALYTLLYDGLPQRMPNMPKGEHSRTSEKDDRQ